MLRKISLSLLLIFIIVQFIHPRRNKAGGAQPGYIGNVYPVPDDVRQIFAKACNDCHSNNTVYPWYAHLQPVHWWLDKHIRQGKWQINYDEYTNQSLHYQYHKMEETVEMVKSSAMPLDSYTWIHKDAILTEAEKNKLIAWATSVLDTLKARYPMDSLVAKK